jgi:hypothetical protein
MTSPDRPFQNVGPETLNRLITTWSWGGGADDLHYLIPAAPVASIARLYRVDGGLGETMLWVENRSRDAHLHEGQAVVGVVANAEMFTFTLMRDVGVVPAVPAPWLYIVHTDIPDDIVGDYNAWYDEEHLPRLVGVPGVERARRYVADGTLSPRYLTAYDLTIKDAFESPAGLKARKTQWTEKMRGLFVNTRRKMCAFEREGSSSV